MTKEKTYFRRLRRAALLGLFWLLSPGALAGECDPLVLTDDPARHTLMPNQRVWGLVDRDGTLTIDDVAALPVSAFDPPQGASFTMPGPASYWLRLCLTRPEDAVVPWTLVVLPPYIPHLTLYRPDGNGFVAQTQGLLEPYENREANYRGFTFALPLEAGESAVYHLRVQSYAHLSFDLLLTQPAGMQRLMAVEYGLFGFYQGMLLLVIAINLMFWYRLREGIYLRYALAMMMLAVFSAIAGGYFRQALPGIDPGLLIRLQMITFAGSGALLALFLLSAFRVATLYPRIYWLARSVVGAYVLILVASLVMPYSLVRGAIFWVNILGVALMTAISLHALFRHASVRLYAVAFLPLQVTFLLGAFQGLGIVPGIPLGDHLPNLGALAHLVLLNLALAKRAWKAEEDRRLLQEQALRQARRTEAELERRVAERTRELDETNTRMQQFVALVSHEFRTPLSIIDAGAQSLEIRLAEQRDQALPGLQRIRRSVGKMLGLIDNCLAEERLSSGSGDGLQREPVDLRELIHQTFADAGVDHGRFARLDLRLPDTPVIVTGDAVLLALVLSNLVDNALKYSPADTRVTLTVQVTPDGRAMIDVRDQGEGVAATERERIFEKYYRAGTAQSRPGTGLGLYLCRELVRRHGGTLELLPAEAGSGGACFRVCLNALANPEQAAVMGGNPEHHHTQ